MSKPKVKRLLVLVASASAVAAINYSLFNTYFVFMALTVLLAHELGHYIIAKINGANPDLPFFIPMPIFSIGVTRIKNMRSLPNSVRRTILAYGPITGFMAALYLLVLSLIHYSIPTVPILTLCISELIFNYFGSDGKKYRMLAN